MDISFSKKLRLLMGKKSATRIAFLKLEHSKLPTSIKFKHKPRTKELFHCANPTDFNKIIAVTTCRQQETRMTVFEEVKSEH